MPDYPRLRVKDLAAALHRSEKTIQELAREAIDRQEGVEWPALRDRTTGAPLTNSEGLAYAVVQAPPDTPGRPPTGMGWAFRPVQPPQRAITLAERYLLSGCVLGMHHQSITAIAVEAGIVPGAPVRALGKKTSTGSMQVTTSNEPGPVLGMLLRPEGTAEGWKTMKDEHVEVLVQGTLLLPAAGPIGYAAVDRLIWDTEALCWRGEPVKARSLLELRGSWGLDHNSLAGEAAATLIDGNLGLWLDWVSHPEF